MINIITALILLSGCADADTSSTTATVKIENDHRAKGHWYDGKAEITSYKLEQARYGEIHEGSAVTVFVTEPFSKKSWTKADNPDSEAVPVMKMNMTKKFNTGIYPYSMMTSTFFPFEDGEQSLKISASLQEWCGHTYMEMLNKKQLEFKVDSYFEGETVADKKLAKTYLEDDFWTMIRLNPKKVPMGSHQVIPSFFYLRLTHQPLKAQTCEISLTEVIEEYIFNFNYPDLNRSVAITCSSEFPYQIKRWSETYESGYGSNRKEITTKATLMESMRVAYWNKNAVAASTYRMQLRLK